MDEMVFRGYMKYSEDETLAGLNVSKDEVPVNISLDHGSDMDLAMGDACKAELWSNEYEVNLYPSEEEYLKAETHMAPISMIPIGTFPIIPDNPDQIIQQNAWILFTGIVREVERNPEPEDGMPIWRIKIDTYALSFDLFYYEDENVEPGFLVHGRAWLYGTLSRTGKANDRMTS